jgi:membrane protein required for beta-lactamase induction
VLHGSDWRVLARKPANAVHEHSQPLQANQHGPSRKGDIHRWNGPGGLPMGLQLIGRPERAIRGWLAAASPDLQVE